MFDFVDEWRIVYDLRHYDNGVGWIYTLQRKKKFLWWTYWMDIKSSAFVETLEQERACHLEEEAKSFKVVREWK